jgi:hypothetical protein
MTDVKRTIRENILALLCKEFGPLPPGQTGISQLMKKGFATSTAQRVLDEDTQIRVDLLEELARKFGLSPWQLLVPSLDPASLPGLTADSTAWPFPMVDRAAYWGLSEAERAFVQSKLDTAISDRVNASRAQPSEPPEKQRRAA